jgi:DNA-binding response OmpR family regulator
MMTGMKKIMLVDDDLDLLLLLRHVLKARGYMVITLDEGSSVLPAIDSVQPDLLILDINIGDHDGRDICREIKQNHVYDHIPVVLFSALVKEKEAISGCQADGYIEKPITTPSFLQKIESLIAA